MGTNKVVLAELAVSVIRLLFLNDLLLGFSLIHEEARAVIFLLLNQIVMVHFIPSRTFLRWYVLMLKLMISVLGRCVLRHIMVLGLHQSWYARRLLAWALQWGGCRTLSNADSTVCICTSAQRWFILCKGSLPLMVATATVVFHLWCRFLSTVILGPPSILWSALVQITILEGERIITWGWVCPNGLHWLSYTLGEILGRVRIRPAQPISCLLLKHVYLFLLLM